MSGLTLRAVTRRKRPSFSPQKWRSGLTPDQQKQRSQSHSSSATLQKELQGLDLAMPNRNTAALEFEEFSYVDDQGKFSRIGTAWVVELCEYLGEHYQAESVSEMMPYLVVWCKDTVPPPYERPFMIAGLVAVWLVQGKDMYPPDIDLGDMGHSDDSDEQRWVFLEPNLLADLEIFQIPKAKTLSAIMNQHFPEALAISYINHRIVVEFNEISHEQHVKRLGSLPRAIAHTEVALRYHNGPVHGQELKRLKEPNPTKFDGQYDDTDYVKAHGCFYPGAMLSSKNNTLISAGILVQKQQKIGLTVAIHCWDEQLKSEVKLGHEDYTLKQGDWADGTIVGSVMERIGSSDIGIAKLDKPFNNRFLDLNGSASSLLHSSELKIINESFWIDSFVTGPQQLASNGLRVFKADKRGKSLFGDPSALPGPGEYVQLVQGIYATSAPEINRQPQIREGVCGAAIIRAREAKLPDSTRTVAQEKTPTSRIPSGQGSSLQVASPENRKSSSKGPRTPSVAGSVTPLKKQIPREETTGEVAGFMHWCDIQSLYNGDRLLCFAETVDGLIEDGWEVVSAPEKRKASAAGLDDDSDPFVTKSSALD